MFNLQADWILKGVNEAGMETRVCALFGPCCCGQVSPEHLVLAVWDLERHDFDLAGKCAGLCERKG